MPYQIFISDRQASSSREIKVSRIGLKSETDEVLLSEPGKLYFQKQRDLFLK